MQPSPRFLGTVAAGLVTAVASGALIGKVPPMMQHGWDYTPSEAGGPPIAGPQPAHAYPDQYALVTPEGRFEVAELREHGLYRQARYRWAEFDASYPTEAWDDEAGFAETQETAPAMPLAAETQPDAASPTEPLPASSDAPLAPVGPAVAEVTPRIVDVAAELAARDRGDGEVAVR